MDDIFSFGLTRANEGDGPPTIHSVISTGNLARDNAIITPEGWDFKAYDANPAVLWNHGRDGRLPIGRTSEHSFDGPKLRATAVMDEKDAFAMEVHGKVQRGFVRAASVRWHPLEYEWRKRKDAGSFDLRHEEEGEQEVLVFLRQEMLEWSLVQVGTDPGAVGAIARMDGSAFTEETLREMVAGPTKSTPSPRDQVAAFLDHLEAIANAADGTPAIDARRLDGSAIGVVRNAESAIAHIVAALAPEPTQAQAPELSDELVGQIAEAVTQGIAGQERLHRIVAEEVAVQTGIPREAVHEALTKED